LAAPTDERSELAVLAARAADDPQLGPEVVDDGDEDGADEDLRVLDMPLPGPISRRVSMATRLAFVVLVVTIISLVVTSVTGLDQGQRLGEDLLRERVDAVRSSQASQVEAKIRQVASQSVALSSSPATAEAIARFGAAADELELLDPAAQAQQSTDLREYYSDEVIPDLEEARGTPVSGSRTFPTSPSAVYLQDAYIANSPAEAGREGSVDDAGDGSTWSAVHSELHPGFRDTARFLRAGDLFLVDRDGDIVYSTSKRTDLATNLDIGPQSGSTLATLFDEIRDDPDGEAVRLTDLSPYGPAGDEPVGFVASPVLDDGDFVGMVALEVPADDLQELMTNGEDWKALGMGETGETYIVSADGTLRSDARAYLEDPEGYTPAAVEAGTLEPEEAERIERAGSTVLFQRANPDTVRAALEAEGLSSGSNYLGLDVVSSYAPLELPDLDWAVIAEIEVEELDQPVADYGGRVVIVIAVFVALLTFGATIWAGRLTAPLRVISARLRRIDESAGSGSLDLTTGQADDVDAEQPEMPANSPRELIELSDSFDHMVSTLQARRQAVVATHDERIDLLRRFLPAAVARRVEQGEREVLDRIPNASVVAVTMRGLGALVRSGTARENRQLLESVLDALDDHAADHGLERVKITGDTYIATCGVNRPYLDHAPRCVRFAADVREAIEDDADGPAADIAVAVGVHSGPVTVGLTGSTLLVYDTWGPTVSRARQIGRAGQGDQILISDETRKQLPPVIAVRRRGVDDLWEVLDVDAQEGGAS
jgi:class 3 adenylate cyclase